MTSEPWSATLWFETPTADLYEIDDADAAVWFLIKFCNNRQGLRYSYARQALIDFKNAEVDASFAIAAFTAAVEECGCHQVNRLDVRWPLAAGRKRCQ